MTGKYLIFRQNCGMITAERVASAAECRKMEKISAIFTAKLESNKLSSRDESLLPEEKKKTPELFKTSL